MDMHTSTVADNGCLWILTPLAMCGPFSFAPSGGNPQCNRECHRCRSRWYGLNSGDSACALTQGAVTRRMKIRSSHCLLHQTRHSTGAPPLRKHRPEGNGKRHSTVGGTALQALFYMALRVCLLSPVGPLGQPRKANSTGCVRSARHSGYHPWLRRRRANTQLSRPLFSQIATRFDTSAMSRLSSRSQLDRSSADTPPTRPAAATTDGALGRFSRARKTTRVSCCVYAQSRRRSSNA